MSRETDQTAHSEQGSYEFTNCMDGLSPSITPFDAMEVLKQDPNQVFPFPIDGVGEEHVEVGRVYELRPLLVDTEAVTVVDETDTSFTFVAEEDHLRGEGAQLTFSTIRNDDGEICLVQSATFKRNIFSPLLNFGSRVMWKIQAERLERVLKRVVNSNAPKN